MLVYFMFIRQRKLCKTDSIFRYFKEFEYVYLFTRLYLRIDFIFYTGIAQFALTIQLLLTAQLSSALLMWEVLVMLLETQMSVFRWVNYAPAYYSICWKS